MMKFFAFHYLKQTPSFLLKKLDYAFGQGCGVGAGAGAGVIIGVGVARSRGNEQGVGVRAGQTVSTPTPGRFV